MVHISVLKNEVLQAFDFLKERENGVVLDCTLGFGGHSKAILQAYPQSRVIGVDRDLHAIKLASENLRDFAKRIEILQSPFGSAFEKLSVKQKGAICAILADIGVSSMHLDDKSRGFSFESSNLDMRMDTAQSLTAREILNTYNLLELERIFFEYGEIRESKKLARAIVEHREKYKETFESGEEFSAFVAQYVSRQKGVNPATQAFQALRIEVNDELGQLSALLDSIKNAYNEGFLRGAKLCIISFHSLEDRIIKNAFKVWSKECICPTEAMKCTCGNNNALGVASKKPILPSSEEILLNKRARSAKMRVFEFRQ
ncbi:16S rRNA (cytosine(1402)-N(4))-methyltransferase [Helicobacter sp. MIT 00-7814]|nr:16S rRNA (cytosine(1402)-N(4))-methyltransferase [Helicobacter sp. MIT 99-10781]RDU53766.1 16S rRNA (cytosine(1402)-N(4))-methyltransferase [Helicobacter sp. MIT 00-7814]